MKPITQRDHTVNLTDPNADHALFVDRVFAVAKGHRMAGYGAFLRRIIDQVPTRQTIASQSGKMPTTSVLLGISLFRLGVVGPDLVVDLAGKAVRARV